MRRNFNKVSWTSVLIGIVYAIVGIAAIVGAVLICKTAVANDIGPLLIYDFLGGLSLFIAGMILFVKGLFWLIPAILPNALTFMHNLIDCCSLIRKFKS